MSFRHEDAIRRYPYDSLQDYSAHDEALETLRLSKKNKDDALPDIPTFADRTLERLKELGLLNRNDIVSPSKVREVLLGERQPLWIGFDTHRDYDEGYMAVEMIEPSPSNAAILAAMIAWVARPIDYEQVREAVRFFGSAERTAKEEEIRTRIERIRENKDGSLEEFVEAFKAIDDLQARLSPSEHMQYILPLLHYYRPDVVRNSSPQEIQDLIEKTCRYVNDFLESLRKLQAFLEHGAPNRKLAPAKEEPSRDVKSTILRDVNGLNYRQIGKRLGIPLPDNYKDEGDHQTVRKTVERGREILEAAFGKEGWQERVEKMKAEKAWWQSLSAEDAEKVWKAENKALDLGISIEEARRRIENRRS